jgi:GMP synthase-like glutamine amidotransferase
MKIAILDLTKHPEPLLTGLRRSGSSIVDWLAPSFEDADFKIYDLAEGADAVPTPDEFDGLILSGSELGVYDAAPWMPSVRDLLMITKQAGKPIFGICFGHQLMAEVFGGKAEKADCGNVVGVRDYTDSHGRRFPAYAWHQDQVTALPPGASVIAAAPYCPIAGLRYDFPACSVQYHPEFTEASISGLLRCGRDHFIDAQTADKAWHEIASQSVSVNLDSHQIASFFRDHQGG